MQPLPGAHPHRNYPSTATHTPPTEHRRLIRSRDFPPGTSCACEAVDTQARTSESEREGTLCAAEPGLHVDCFSFQSFCDAIYNNHVLTTFCSPATDHTYGQENPGVALDWVRNASVNQLAGCQPGLPAGPRCHRNLRNLRGEPVYGCGSSLRSWQTHGEPEATQPPLIKQGVCRPSIPPSAARLAMITNWASAREWHNHI